MLDKTFDPAEIEARIYAQWEKSGVFAAHPDSGKRPFCVMMPPPNVTGSLHMGHALNHTLQDILIRFERMRGRDALWQPGTDHAGIATQMVVERNLEQENITRQDLGRGAFIDRVWKWKSQSGGAITRQLRALGRLARLEPRALHHGRGAQRRRPQGVRGAVQGRTDQQAQAQRATLDIRWRKRHAASVEPGQRSPVLARSSIARGYSPELIGLPASGA